MKITSWRIVKSKRANEFKVVNGLEMPAAFDGIGASLYPGRWNSKGTSLVYTASSQSLATLEILVHLDDSFLLESYSIFPVVFDDKYVITLDVQTNDVQTKNDVLPKNWRKNPPSQETRILGDHWFRHNHSLVLGVPSAVIPNEVNYLINPYHPDIEKLQIGDAQVFPFDSRLT